jgi:hypothetical protein
MNISQDQVSIPGQEGRCVPLNDLDGAIHPVEAHVSESCLDIQRVHVNCQNLLCSRESSSQRKDPRTRPKVQNASESHLLSQLKQGSQAIPCGGVSASSEDNAWINDNPYLAVSCLSIGPWRYDEEILDPHEIERCPLPLLIGESALFEQGKIRAASHEGIHFFIAGFSEEEKTIPAFYPSPDEALAKCCFILLRDKPVDQLDMELLIGVGETGYFFFIEHRAQTPAFESG